MENLIKRLLQLSKEIEYTAKEMQLGNVELTQAGSSSKEDDKELNKLFKNRERFNDLEEYYPELKYWYARNVNQYYGENEFKKWLQEMWVEYCESTK